ncbi:aldo/keto reductase [Anaerosolibacter sp.]|uniref:aldo/keto reductase n=1 Tax=Anaerosolibacter sp. TaxID=1872527 RepID=UPI0039EFC94F
MQYRKFGKLDFEVPVLGFGCMRLPVLDNDSGKIDEKEAIKMLRYGIDHGITYIDTAYPYHKGNSELLVGKALKDGYREKVTLATKLPVWLTHNHEDFDKYLNEQLSRLNTDHIDFYLLHSLDQESWNKVKSLGVLDFLDKALADGRIKYAGFSFHDEFPVFKEIFDAYNWSFCQIQLNYMDENYQAGLKGLNYAAERNVAVVIMEPLKGGKLAMRPPASIQEIWDTADQKRTPADWALRWLCNFPGVSVILSGMSNLEQVVENIRIVEDALPLSLTSKELGMVQRAAEQYRSLTKVQCTSCEYCLPCPSGVDIPKNFSLYNDTYIYGDVTHSSFVYNNFLPEAKRASACVACNACESLCPQHIPISRHMEDVHKRLGKQA